MQNCAINDARKPTGANASLIAKISRMKRYFDDMTTLDRFTRELDCHQDERQCHHCFKHDQFVSHGFVYKQRSQSLREAIGKRLFCSNRYGRTGCGRTFQLYIREALPGHRYNTHHLFIFLDSLLKLRTVQQAYEKATGTGEPRNAWRWLNKLQAQLIRYRCVLETRSEEVVDTFKSRCKRLQILLPTIQRLFLKISAPPCACYQVLNQTSFI